MSLEVAAWNVAKGLGIPKRRGAILAGFQQLNSDVIVVSEAFSTNNKTPDGFVEEVQASAETFCNEHGYESLTTVAYEDEDTTRQGAPEGFEQYLMVLGRNALYDIDQIRLGSRNALELFMRDHEEQSGVWAIASHFDDRSEELRGGMVDAALGEMDLTKPTVVLGDLNAAAYRSWSN
jgi:endonuclease/exonuclease/phosphatase family metal-dependent hydrolase